jgi:hypothetical protein
MTLKMGDLSDAEFVASLAGERFGQDLNSFSAAQYQSALLSISEQGTEITPELEFKVAVLTNSFVRQVADALATFGDELADLGAWPKLATQPPWAADEAGIKVMNENGSVWFDGKAPIKVKATA